VSHDGVVAGIGCGLGAAGTVVSPEFHHLLVGEEGVIGAKFFPPGVGKQPLGDGVRLIPAAALGIAGKLKKGVETDEVLPDGGRGALAFDEGIAPEKDGGVAGVGVVLLGLDEEIHEVLQCVGVVLEGAGGKVSGGAVFEVCVGGGAELALGGRGAGHGSDLLSQKMYNYAFQFFLQNCCLRTSSTPRVDTWQVSMRKSP
jgi:hypothetical protein